MVARLANGGTGIAVTDVRPPTLGDFVYTLRTRASGKDGQMTRQQLASLTQVSIGYIAKIEAGEARSPSPSVLDALIRVFDLDENRRRHLYDLARVTPIDREAAGQRPIEDYRRHIGPGEREALRNVSPQLMAYLDERWNIVQCNEEYDRTFPELREAGNVLTWFFSSACSRRVMVDWEDEARLTVAWFRALMGRYYDDSWASTLLASLEDFPEFREFWTTTDVGFGRPSPFMRLRDPITGELSIINVDVYGKVVGDYAMQVYLGIRIDPSRYAELGLSTETS